MKNIRVRDRKSFKNVLQHILTDITELNELIFTGAKFVSNKIGSPLRSKNKKRKPEWEMSREGQIRKL